MKKIISQRIIIKTREAEEPVLGRARTSVTPVLALPSEQQVLYRWIKGKQTSARQSKKINEEITCANAQNIQFGKINAPLKSGINYSDKVLGVEDLF